MKICFVSHLVIDVEIPIHFPSNQEDFTQQQWEYLINKGCENIEHESILKAVWRYQSIIPN